ncbi:MAG: MlaD family protein [Proteobacteria bacterium]|jgi:phospholipid/cholesterol/gamma-HCH transport system substrate-binding protein|nr:MlaD family protein [Pseudomonadota bacterium]
MNLLQAAEFKVGLLVLVVTGLIGYMSMQVSNDPSYLGRNHSAWFQMPDAGGLVRGSSVKSAGIPVGIIKEISLTEDGQARVDMTLKPDFELQTSASVEIKSQGILGDKFVSLNPGLKTDPPLEEGGQVLNVKDQGSLDSVITQVGSIASSLKETAQALQEAVTEDGTKKHVLGRIVKNIEVITADLADITSENKEKINSIVDQVNSVTKSLDEILNEQGEDSLKNQLKRTMARLDNTMKNVEEISGKINRGEGTIGRLVNDEETVEELNTAITGVNSFLDTAGKTSTSLDFNTQYLGDLGLAKTNVGIKIQPGLDRYYYIGIVDDPTGVVEKTFTETSNNGGPVQTVDERKTYKSKVKFNLQFAKNFYDFTVRGGLIENAGGVGADYYFWRRRMRASIEAFDFSNVNLRAQLQYNVWKGIYLMGGGSDLLNRQSKRSSYIGAGLQLSNDDLKLLLTQLPSN